MNYKKTWFGWINFCVGTLFMGVFLFASLVSMFEYIGITTSLFDLAWLRVSFVVSFAVILGILGIVILWHFVKKRIPISDSLFSNSVSNYVTRIAFITILTAGIYLRFKLVPDSYTDIVSSKYLDKIMTLFNNGSIGEVDAITYVYCHIGAFFYRVFGIDNFSLYYLNIFFQMFAFVFLFYSIRITFGKTVALFSYVGMFLTSLPLEFVNRITPDSLILFVVSIVILTITLFMNDLSNGVVKSNWNFIIFSLLALIQGGLILVNPAFIVIPFYFSIHSLLIVKKGCNDNLVNKRFTTTIIFMGGSNLVVLISLIIRGLVINDFALAFSHYASNIGWSSLIRFFIYPSEYLITCIICFAFAFIGFLCFIFSDNDYISAITLLFALLYVVFAKNMIAYDLSFYFVILYALFMGFGVKRMFFEGYGANALEQDEFDEISKVMTSDKEDVLIDSTKKEEDKDLTNDVLTENVPASDENTVNTENTDSTLIKEFADAVNNAVVDESKYRKDKKYKDATTNEEHVNIEDNISLADGENSDIVNEVPKKDKIKFIDNILPLPKPHVKKSLDYAFEPSLSEMKYDYEISDDDDFDLP